MYVTCLCCYTQEPFNFLPGAIWLTTCSGCVVSSESILISAKFQLLMVLSFTMFGTVSSPFLASVSLFVVYCPCTLPFLRSSDVELSNSCLQPLQLYKLVDLCQLVPANLMASTWDLFTTISMLMNFESLKSRYHCVHIHNFSCALLRD